jgi:hypothetical protein
MSDYPPEEQLPAESAIDEIEAPPRNLDPLLIYLILVIVNLVGLRGVSVDARYTVIWTLAAALALLSLLVDRVELPPARTGDLIAGLGIGLVVGVPVMIIGAPALRTLSGSLFSTTSDSSIFQMLVFTMPLAETLLFRAGMQATRGMIATGVAASLWSLLLFFPALAGNTPLFVAIVIGAFFIFISFLYSYIRERSGILGAWACQVTINVLLFFAVRFIGG